MAEEGLKCYVVETDGQTIDISVYCRYFAENIQSYSIVDGNVKVYDGISFDDYAYKRDQQTQEQLKQGEFPKDLMKLIQDKELVKIQKEIINTTKINLDPLNFLELCAFVNAIVRERYFVLLKPTIKDTLEELKDITKITFTSKNGSNTETTNTKLINFLLDSAKEPPKEDCYETFKLVKMDQIIDNIYLQSKFAYYLAGFLKEYFPNAVRRANCCMVSLPEQRFILRMLSYFGLAPDGITLTDSRFRQLISFYKNNHISESISRFPDIGYLAIEFVKYQDWRKKNWFKHPLHPLETGDTINFSEL